MSFLNTQKEGYNKSAFCHWIYLTYTLYIETIIRELEDLPYIILAQDGSVLIDSDMEVKTGRTDY